MDQIFKASRPTTNDCCVIKENVNKLDIEVTKHDVLSTQYDLLKKNQRKKKEVWRSRFVEKKKKRKNKFEIVHVCVFT